MKGSKGKHTICIHEGEIFDEQFGGAISPIYLSSSYPFIDQEEKRYPRYFNTPNQEVIAKKIAALEHAEAAAREPARIDIESWEEELHLIQTGELDYAAVVQRHLARLEERVREAERFLE